MFAPTDKYDIIDDVQRVEDKCQLYLNELNSYFGTSISLVIKSNWTREDLPTIEEMERIRSNLQTLVSLVANYTIDQFGNRFLYSNANQFEKALELINEFIIYQAITDKPVAGFYCAGEPINLMAERS